ncbi:DNA glycosylase [Melanogaster broomeanus]|nr:DNA glycosylase [Melanogaster broomeanus]
MPKRKQTRPDSDSDASAFLEDETSKRARVSATATATEQRVRDTSIVATTHPASWHAVRDIDVVRESLLAWYDKIHEVRGMPWRKTYDPSLDKDGKAQRAYEVWVSEIMLQQTQVVTVIPYYKKWMAKFPTIRDLAASDIETVNSLWKGLGYYSRAARLLNGAQKVVKELDDMQSKIPGIGRYSAGAICSIAYNQCVPVLDGNVIRLMSRFLGRKQAQDMLWAAAEGFVESSSRPGDINQALIELGSTVCKVRDPACSDCALRPWCRAYQRTQIPADAEADIEELCTLCEPLPADEPDTGLVTTYPIKVERKKAREELDSVNVIEWRTWDKRERYFMLVRRPEGGIPFPHASLRYPNISGASATAAKVAEIPHGLLRNLLVHPPSHQKDSKSQSSSMRVVYVKPAGDVVHIFSHIKKTYRVQWVVLEGGDEKPPELQNSPIVVDRFEDSDAEKCGSQSTTSVARWIALDEVKDATIGTGVTKVWNLVQMLWK